MPDQNGLPTTYKRSPQNTANVEVVVGTQWGDEGKGKLVDLLSEEANVVCRCQGGNNAGHTVIRNGVEYFFHLMPSGLISERCLGIVGNGTVVYIPGLFHEIEESSKKGLANLEKRLKISDRCHIVFDLHQTIDKLEEEMRGVSSIGTTKKGIGPAYSSKITRNGIRMCDIVGRWDAFAAKYEQLVEYAKRSHPQLQVDPKEDLKKLQKYRDRLSAMVCDTVMLMNELLGNPKCRILIEGAQSCMLDVDFGTYPHVTSSNCTVGGVCTGLGIPPSRINHVYGVMKAYTTRVGSGPFPTELHDDLGGHLQAVGKEWGVTTKRKRRVGWLDIVLIRYANMINGFTALALTKLDVLDGLEEVRIGQTYIDPDSGRELPTMPADSSMLNQVTVSYKTLPGWTQSTCDCTRFDQLPEAARNYVLEVERLCGVPIRWIGTGASRSSIIVRDV